MYEVENIVPVILVQNDEYWLRYSLECLSGHFCRYVIYDIGSQDNTREIIQRFVDKEKNNADFYVKLLPDCPREIQGCFRNSMIAETLSDWYFEVDGDEVYNERSIQNIVDSYTTMMREYEFNGKLYGVVRRLEICDDLGSAYGVNDLLSHHRIYHRTAIWLGNHPGERPYFEQKGSNELFLSDINCMHFHNCDRSRYTAQFREQRKEQHTYRKGYQYSYDLFGNLPIIEKPIHPDLPYHPRLMDRHGVTDGRNLG